jgi:membrane fusion protein (multidrug efflux system)
MWLIFHTEATRTNTGKKERPPPVVYTEKVSSMEMDDALVCIGTPVSRESVVITAQVSEKVTRVNFEDGQSVKQGDVLIELDNAQELAAMQVAELSIAEHEREQARLVMLVKTGAVAQRDLDDRETRLAMARAAKLRAEAELAYRVIKAPFAGDLGLRLVSLGDLVAPGTRITTLDDLEVIYVDFPAPEKYAAKLSPGQPFKVTNEAYPGVTFEGKIKLVEPRVNTQSRSVQVRGVMDNADRRIKPGMYLKVSLTTSVEEVLVVPEAALVSLGEKQYLFVIPEGSDRVVKTEVRVGRRVNRWAELTGGAGRGTVFVTDGIGKVTDGQQVTVEARPGKGAAREDKAE